MTEVVGHSRQRKTLQRLFSKQLLPHALLFVGTAGIGKRLVASELYRGYYCLSNLNNPQPEYGGCRNCKSCRLFDANSLPDFKVIDCSVKDDSNTEAMRELLYSLHLKVSTQSQRVVIFDNAERLSEQASNILLKILEEPRERTYFCLISTSLSRLLPTVVSRSQTWFFNTLTQAEIKTVLQNRPVSLSSNQEIAGVSDDMLALLADGSLEHLESMLSNAQEWTRMQEVLDLLTRGASKTALERLALKKEQRDVFFSQLTILRILCRQQLLANSDNQTISRWAALLANLIEAERAIFERYLGTEAVLRQAFQPIVGLQSPAFTSSQNDVTLLSDIIL